MAVALTLAFSLLICGQAFAVTALTAQRFDAQTILVYDGSDSVANNVTITRTGSNAFHIADTAGDVVAQAPCVQNGAAADCPAALSDSIQVVLKGGNDHLIVTGSGGPRPYYCGGDGTDTLDLSGATTTEFAYVAGGKGPDTLTDGASSDRLVPDTNSVALSDACNGVGGGSANDTVTGGGGGNDSVDYSDAGAAVNVDLSTGSATGASTGTDTLSGVEAVYGSPFNDTLTGDANGNVLFSGPGNDTMAGGGGFDYVDYFFEAAAVTVNIAAGTASGTSTGSDTFTGIEGAEGSAFNDKLTGDAADNVFYGSGGMDVVDYSGSASAVAVDLAAHNATGTSIGTDTLITIEGAIGSALPDTLTGDQFSNKLTGGGGNDVIDGAGDFDFADYAGEAQGVTVDLGAGSATGGSAGTDTLSNIEGVFGSGHTDSLTGDAEVNDLAGGGGNDTIDGAGNFDLADYSVETAGVTVNLATGSATGTSTGTDTLSNVEGVDGSPFPDNITGSGDPDFILGEGGGDTITAGDGDDNLGGGAGNDTLSGGPGEDFADYGSESAAVVVNLGAGTATGASTGSDTLTSIEDVNGSDFGDTLTGGPGPDYLVGGAGNDTIDGAGDDDELVGDAGDDHLDGGTDGATGDLVNYSGETAKVDVDLEAGTGSGTSAGDDTLTGIEQIGGSAFDDTLKGDDNANAIIGGDGKDTIDGRGGIDGLTGDAGDDTIEGGTGVDTVNYMFEGALVQVNLGGGAPQATGATAGNDTISGVEAVTGTEFGDTITGDGGNNTVAPLGGNDTVQGGGGTDLIRYSSEADGVQVDLSDAGSGNVTGTSTGTDTVHGFENIAGSEYADDLTGDDGANYIFGLGGNDTIDAKGGDDVVAPLEGNDTVEGGSGPDAVDYGDETQAVQVDLAGGTATGASTGSDTLSGFSNVFGSAHGDTITGDDFANAILAGAGNDTVNGGAGENTLSGEDGNDTVTGGSNRDILSGGDGNDTLNGGGELDGLDGDAGNDTLNGGDGIDSLCGGEGDDSEFGDAGDDLVFGGAGSDTLHGGDGLDNVVSGIDAGPGELCKGTPSNADTDSLYGDAGDDLLWGADSADTEDGGPGNDTLFGYGGNDHLNGGDGIDRAIGYAGNDTIDGGAGDDFLSGGEGDDTVRGGDGNDALGDPFLAPTDNGNSVKVRTTEAGNDSYDGGPGDDKLQAGPGDKLNIYGEDPGQVEDSPDQNGGDHFDGGPGIDSVSYVHRSSPVSVSMDGAANDGGAGEGDSVAQDIEILIGGEAGDTISGRPADDRIDGGNGDDTLAGAEGNDSIAGGAGNDTVAGDAGDDSLTGGDGTDTLDGGDGADNLDGGGGDDTLRGAAANDILAGGAGSDTADGGAGDDTIRGGADALVGADAGDTLAGGDGNDSLSGDDGDDTLAGGPGTDTLAGNAGSDTADYSALSVPVNVTLDGVANDGPSGESDSVAGDVENVTGGSGNDTLRGSAGQNRLVGGAGNDDIDGAAGTDDVDAGAGDDKVAARDDEVDVIACGAGLDVVLADVIDRLKPDCEDEGDLALAGVRLGKAVMLSRVSGKPTYRVPGRGAVALTGPVAVPVGTMVDATRGRLAITAAKKRGTATAHAGGASFRLSQQATGLTSLALTGGKVRRCGSKRRALRKLELAAPATFRVVGRRSTGTPAGSATFTTEDRCDGTRTRVAKGRVSVRDLARKRTLNLRKGTTYLARG